MIFCGVFLCISVKELHICFSVLKIKLCEIEIQAWEPSVAQGTHKCYPGNLNLIKTMADYILGTRHLIELGRFSL